MPKKAAKKEEVPVKGDPKKNKKGGLGITENNTIINNYYYTTKPGTGVPGVVGDTGETEKPQIKQF